jgi:hypothetical protein
MNEETRNDYKRHPKHQLPSIEDAYFLDSASGLYKRKSSEEKDHRTHDHQGRLRVSVARDWIAIAISVTTLAVVLLYTYYAKRTVEVSQEGQQRALIKVGDDEITLTKTPDFSSTGGPRDYPPSAPFSGFVMAVEYPLTIQNTGNVPARRYSVWEQLVLTPDRRPEIPNWWGVSCQIAENNMHGGLQYFRPFFPGTLHLPGYAQLITDLASFFNLSFNFSPNTATRLNDWGIVVCVSYEEMNGNVHHTAVMYCAMDGQFDNSSSKRIDLKKGLDKPEVWYAPESRFTICDNDSI